MHFGAVVVRLLPPAGWMEYKFGYTAGCAENDLLIVEGIIKGTIYKCKDVAETLQQAQLLLHSKSVMIIQPHIHTIFANPANWL